jgi:hypothetical protein
MTDTTEQYNPSEELNKAITDSEQDVTDWEALVRERFGEPTTESAPTTGESGPSEVVERTGEEAQPAETTPPPSPDTWEFDDGISINKEVAESYARFDAFLQANPQIADIIKQSVEQAQATPAQVPPEPAPIPEDIDLDNPTVKFLFDQYNSTKTQLDQALQLIQRHDVQLNTQTNATAESTVNRVCESFQKEKGLTDEEVMRIRHIASNLNVMEPYMETTDPITGAPKKPDPLGAVEHALDLAYWSIPEFREKEIERRLKLNRENAEKQRKLSSLGGSSGSTPREQPTPQTKEEMQAAMIREVADMIGVPPSS